MTATEQVLSRAGKLDGIPHKTVISSNWNCSPGDIIADLQRAATEACKVRIIPSIEQQFENARSWTWFPRTRLFSHSVVSPFLDPARNGGVQ